MKEAGKTILTVVLILAVMAYTGYNYWIGKTDQQMFVVSMIVLAVPLVNIIRILIRQWKEDR